MSWIDEPESHDPAGRPGVPSPTRRASSGTNRRSSSRSRPTMWWIGLSLVIGGAIVAWILAAFGETPAGKSDFSDILIAILGVVAVLAAVLGYGLYQDAAFQSGGGTFEPAWKPTTIARVALFVAFIAGVVHAWRIADLISRLGLV